MLVAIQGLVSGKSAQITCHLSRSHFFFLPAKISQGSAARPLRMVAQFVSKRCHEW
jgi:hypothetical protein